MTAQYKNAGTVVPLINGIKKLKFVLKSGLGITKFNADRQGRLVPDRPIGRRAGEGHLHRRPADRRDRPVLRDVLPGPAAGAELHLRRRRLDAALQVT